MRTTFKRISGDIFSNQLHDMLNLDGLILQVRYGFNPIDAAWDVYSKNPNPRIDDNTMVYAYNTPSLREPSREELPALIHAQLDTMAARGVQRLALNPLFFRNEAGERQGGKEADRLLDEAIMSWLGLGDNDTLFEVIYVVDKYAKGVPTFEHEAMRQFRMYVNNEFKMELEDWFELSKRSSWPHNPSAVIVSSETGLKDREAKASLPFKATCLVMSTFAQSAGQTAHLMDPYFAMTKVLGFPVIDRVMAGIVNPLRTMEVCCLLPSVGEVDAYRTLVKMAQEVIGGKVLATLGKERVKSVMEHSLIYYLYEEKANLLDMVASYLHSACLYLQGKGECPGDILSPDVVRMIG